MARAVESLAAGLTEDGDYLANPGDPDTSDHDCIQADGSSNIWIDHCIFDDPSGDGLVDLRKDTTFFTVSNTIFRGHDKTFGIGGCYNLCPRIFFYY